MEVEEVLVQNFDGNFIQLVKNSMQLSLCITELNWMYCILRFFAMGEVVLYTLPWGILFGYRPHSKKVILVLSRNLSVMLTGRAIKAADNGQPLCPGL